MKHTLTRVSTWIAMHPRLATAIVLAALVVAAFVLVPDLGIARRHWKP